MASFLDYRREIDHSQGEDGVEKMTRGWLACPGHLTSASTGFSIGTESRENSIRQVPSFYN